SQTAGEENIRAGPESLVNRKPRVPYPPDNQTDDSRDEELRDFLDRRARLTSHTVSGEHAQQRRGQRTHRAQQTFRVINDSLLPDVRAQQTSVDVRSQASF